MTAVDAIDPKTNSVDVPSSPDPKALVRQQNSARKSSRKENSTPAPDGAPFSGEFFAKKASTPQSAKAFGVSQGDVSKLVNHPTKCPARLREYEARRPVDSDGEAVDAASNAHSDESAGHSLSDTLDERFRVRRIHRH